MTQQEFADKIGIKRNSLANYETGRNTPIDAIILSICREFNVSEDWLRNGTGDMFRPVDRDAEIAAFVGKALSNESDSFKKRFISMLSRMTDDEWILLEKKVREFAFDDAEMSDNKGNVEN